MKLTEGVSFPSSSPTPQPVASETIETAQAHATVPTPSPVAQKIRFPFFRAFLFSLVGAGLSFFFLFVDFPGISTAGGMEQAEVARSLARGDGMTSRVLRPAALATVVEKNAEDAGLPNRLRATSGSWLNAWVNAGLLKLSGTDFPVDFQYRIFFPDRVIAAGSVFFFVAALGLTFLLVARMFDGVLAGFTVGAMLVCETMWRFTQTGLPQMLGLFLFTAALFFLYRALEKWRLERVPFLWLMASGLGFGLLVLASPMGLGVLVGAVLFVVVVFRSRIWLPVCFGVIAGVTTLPWMLGNFSETGSLLGTEALAIQESWGESAGSPVMRNFEPGGEEAAPRFFLARKMGRVLEQHFENFFLLIGGSVGAGLFFLSLLHPFRNRDAALLRNGLAAMWAGALLTMTMWGTPALLFDANQVHVWFVPVATGFGLAILSVFWMRLPIAQNRGSLWRLAHLAAAVALTGLPMLINLPGRAVVGFNFSNRVVHWPPYDPAAITHLSKISGEDQVIFSDVPWAVAWYADRSSVWIPETTEQFQEIANRLERENPKSVAGLFLTPQTLDRPLASGIMGGDYRDWNRILLTGPMRMLDVEVYEKLPTAMRYATRLSASRTQESWYFSPRPIEVEESVRKGPNF